MRERQRRRMQKKKRETKRFCLIAIVMIWIISIGTMAMAAQVEKVVYYESIQVKWGDTLWDIAKQYKEKGEDTEHMLRKIQELNGMHTDNICSGERILIPIVKEKEQ